MHRLVRTILLRLRSVFQRARVERELNDELSFHLAMEERELIARGVAPDEVRAEALRRFGSPTAMADACRDERGVQLLDELRQDVRFAVRTLAKLPVVTLTVILTLGIGIAANTAVFAFVDAMLLARLRVPHPEQVIAVLIGLGLGALASEVVRHQLFGITALDPIALSSAVLILLVVSAVANYLPARRAARLDPILILRD